MRTLRLGRLLPVKVVVEFQFEAVLGLPAAGRENPTYGILDREEETCCRDWRLSATKLERAGTPEVAVLNNHAPPLYSALACPSDADSPFVWDGFVPLWKSWCLTVSLESEVLVTETVKNHRVG